MKCVDDSVLKVEANQNIFLCVEGQNRHGAHGHQSKISYHQSVDQVNSIKQKFQTKIAPTENGSFLLWSVHRLDDYEGKWVG